MEPTLSFGYWVRRRRKALDLTQAALAERVGCATGTIKHIEADERRPSRHMAERLADCLHIPPEEHVTFIRAARAELSPDQLASLPQPLPPEGNATASSIVVERLSLPSGTATFLFTDIEGSTKLWEQNPVAMRKALARHDTILWEAIETHAGVVFKTSGDGVYAAFARASDALAAALAAQNVLHTTVWDTTSPLRIRMALHTGTAEVRAGNYFGLPLNRVARLMAAGHGGQILLTLATQELVRDELTPEVALRDIGTHRLKDLTRPEQIFQVVAADLPTKFLPLNMLDAQPHNLPVQPTPLIGREADVARLCDLLRRPDTRLVTVTGSGGVGKTRLALQVAAELLDAFPDGVYLVLLASVSDPTSVATTIAQTLGVNETGDRPFIESLRNYLRAKQLLLLLDNFEQMMTAAPLLSELLAAAPQVHMLVTSREVLRLRGEKEFAVTPLALPNPEHVPTSESLSQYAAVQLFIQQARDAKPDFTVTDTNAPAVAEICHRLDGLPLAIELAAACVKLFTPEALLTRLARPLPMLTRGARDLPARQKTMRNTIAWSYNLLDAGEQTLFRRLAVFVGGCTVEAAESICDGMGDLPFATLDGLASLVDKNLVQHIAGADSSLRFIMLETIRDYALEQLALSGEADLMQRHAHYYLTLAERAELANGQVQEATWYETLKIEVDNLRAALTWLRTENRAEEALRLAAGLGWFWHACGCWREGREWLGYMLRHPTVAPHTILSAKALRWAGYLAHMLDNTEAISLLEESLTITRELGDQAGSAHALYCLGQIASVKNAFASAYLLFEESLALYRAMEYQHGVITVLSSILWDKYVMGDLIAVRIQGQELLLLARSCNDDISTANALNLLGNAADAEGDFNAARTVLEESLALCRKIGRPLRTAFVLINLGMVLTRQAYFGTAHIMLEESLALARKLGDSYCLGVALSRLGYLAHAQDDNARAITLYHEGLKIGMSTWKFEAAWLLEHLAQASVLTRAPAEVMRLLGAAEAIRQRLGTPVFSVDRAEHYSIVAAISIQLGNVAGTVAWAEGRAMSIEQAIAYALNESM